jgi:hypothetical protein
MIFVRQLAAVAARRRAERAINTIAPMRTTKPMTIQIQMGREPDSFGVAVALGCATGAGAAELEGADEVTDGTGELVLASGEELAVVGGELAVVGGELAVVGGELTAWLDVRLETALLTLLAMPVPHAVARPAAQSIVTARSRLLISSRIPGPFLGNTSASPSAWPVCPPAASPRTDECGAARAYAQSSNLVADAPHPQRVTSAFPRSNLVRLNEKSNNDTYHLQ